MQAVLPRRSTSLSIAALWILVGSAAAAQGPLACDSIIRASAVPAERTVQFVITSGAGGKIPLLFSKNLAERLAGEFTMPAQIETHLYSGLGRFATDTLARGKSTWVHPGLMAFVRVKLDRSGLPRRVGPVELSLDANLDSTFVGVIHRIFTDTVWLLKQDVATQFRGDSAVIDIDLDIASVLTKKERAKRDKKIRAGEIVERPIGRIVLPHYANATEPAVPWSEVPKLEYPVSQMEATRNGHVEMRAILDANGAVIASSVWFNESTHRDFEIAIRNWLPRVLYRPAKIAGCPIAMRVTQPFNFNRPVFRSDKAPFVVGPGRRPDE